jgi:hypothetical protein
MAFSKSIDKQRIEWRTESISLTNRSERQEREVFHGFLGELRGLRGSRPDFEKAIRRLEITLDAPAALG